ncbi:hypothetical protein HID58_040032 [Brassica napus]|uniref:Uncharacterized protein n=1 Tax=Brassica napus TaxID=3708 RepID=A0ABQ8B6U2_BRANA|nr:hypothetical protein HID58_040032 [Brassica napus]
MASVAILRAFRRREVQTASVSAFRSVYGLNRFLSDSDLEA